MKESFSVYDGVQKSAVVADERDVVGAEQVAVWCWVEWNTNVRLDFVRYDRDARYPTSTTTTVRTTIV